MRSVITAAGVIVAGLISSTSAGAATVAYTSQAAFQTALDGPGYKLVNFDTLGGLSAGYRLDDAAPAAALAGLGLDSIGYNAQVVAGQDFQTPTARDRLIDNGVGFGGHIAFSFATAVNGVGAFSNNIDYGRVRLFSNADLTGFLGEAFFGKTAPFGGITSDVGVRSVQFTCDFNGDLKCGVYDIQFGTFAPPPPPPTGGIPEPGSWALMILGFGGAGAMIRSRRLRAA
jgi:hypothetical protein